jgi:polyphosphate glucokinase
MQILGVDIGGTGIKGAIVETDTGELITERKRIETPRPATPEAVAATLRELVRAFEWKGPIGCGFPATIHHGVAFTAANIDPTWVDTAVDSLFTETTGCPCHVINDADAAGICEMRLGAGKGRKGVVMLLTIGTGIGSAVFVDGILHPNTELGHLLLETKHGAQKAEHYCSERVRVARDLGWNKFGRRFGKFLNRLEFLFNPDLFIIGGGVSKKFDRFSPNFTLRTEIKVAETLNQAGIIGAALCAADRTLKAGEDPAGQGG